MTVSELQAQRDKILARIGIARQQFGERSVEYADAEKSLSLIDSEIAKAQAAAAGTKSSRVSYATFPK
jgi:hypothetical protein